jgi:hypothetical protein
MKRIYYAIVDGDPLTSGGYVVVPPDGDTIQDDEGRRREIAYIGHNAWCAKCKTMGRIIGGSGVSKPVHDSHECHASSRWNRNEVVFFEVGAAAIGAAEHRSDHP